MKRKVTLLVLCAALALGLSACGSASSAPAGSDLESGISAIEDAMTKQNHETENAAPTGSDLRSGTSADTVATPDDFPAEYDGVSTGRIVLNGWPHGFGADGGWVAGYAAWLETVFTDRESS